MRRIFLLLLVVLIPVGCATTSNQPEKASVDALVNDKASDELPGHLQLIAKDFSNALSQLSAAVPANTTIHFASEMNDDLFTRAIHESLMLAGYGTRWVAQGDREHFLQYQSRTEASDRLRHREVYELAVGDIEMRRTYDTDISGKVTPFTPLYVRGTDATGIVLDDSIFNEQSNTTDKKQQIQATVEPGQESTPARFAERVEPTVETAPSAGPPAIVVPAESSPLDPLVASLSNKPVELPLVDFPRLENVFERGGSNFQSVLEGYELVAEQILAFPNDSLRLGQTNKKIIKDMVGQFSPESDVFSVIGCSMGPTGVSGGNAALALGRASRVVEALLFAGVAKTQILDEGCWASDKESNSLPTRGVVVTLNRRRS